jgi:hypothetical protein
MDNDEDFSCNIAKPARLLLLQRCTDIECKDVQYQSDTIEPTPASKPFMANYEMKSILYKMGNSHRINSYS